MANTLVGLFDDRDVAQNAVQDLVNAGFSRDKISVIANDGSGGIETQTLDSDGNLAAEGASAGLSSGAVVGGVAGLLIGAGFTVLPIAGFLLAGPIAGLIAGAAAGAATGGIVGGLIGLGIPEEHAEYYAEGVRRGGTLVTIQVDQVDESRARDILNRDGAVDIDTRSASWREQGYTGYDSNAKPYTTTQIAEERSRYGGYVNNDWNDTSDAPAPSTVSTNPNSTTGSIGGVTSGSGMVGGTGVNSTTGGLTNTNNFDRDSAVVNSTTGVSGSTYGTDYNASGTMGEDYETGYRSHFSSNYPNERYEDYAPAYNYGREIAAGDGGWETNEMTYRNDWESRHPGTWDKVKASVRHAYDSAKNTVTGGKDGNRATLY